MGGGDVAPRAGIRDRSVGCGNAEQRIDRDVCGCSSLLARRSADGGLNLGEPVGSISPNGVA